MSAGFDAAGCRTVLFDLDGTLSDSAPGILAALRQAFADAGVPWIDDDTARSMLGPPFSHSLPPLVGEHRVADVVAAYRRHYVDELGLFDTSCYPGVIEVLDRLAGLGYRMAVATSKPEPHAGRIIEHLGLAGYFATVCGDTLDGRLGSKALVVGEALRRLDDPPAHQVLMVGDRSHDVLGAAAHGVSCAGVLWGYGSAAELTAAGALRLCGEPGQLLEVLGIGGDQRPGQQSAGDG